MLGVFLLLIVLGNLFIKGYTHEDLEKIHQRVQTELATLEDTNKAAATPLMNSIVKEYNDIKMLLYDQNGNIIYSTDGHERVTYEELSSMFVEQPYNLFSGKDTALLYKINIGDQEFYLVLQVEGKALSNVQVYVYLTENYYAFLFLYLPLAVITLLPALLISSFFITVNRRIKRLNDAMQKSDLNQLPAPIADKNKDEIGQLNHLFYEMSVRLNQQYSKLKHSEETRKALVSNLSHDLRTPLTTISGYAETLQQGSMRYSDEQISLYASIILQRSRYIEYLLNKLFELSKLDREMIGEMTRSDLCELTRQIVADYMLIFEEKNFLIEISIPEAPIWIELNEYAIGQAIRNLIDNALIYGEEGQYIGIHLEQTQKNARLTVTDKGKGIPSSELKNIFDRFVRLDKSRSSGNIGIGLSIAKEVIGMHHGIIYSESDPGIYTRFVIELNKENNKRLPNGLNTA